MIKVLELVPYWPAEIFIQRHISAFSEIDLTPQVITKKVDYSLRYSSIKPTRVKVKEMPTFDGLNTLAKLSRIKSLIGDTGMFFENKSWEEKVLLNFFKREKPDLIHFHWADFAIKWSWIPIELNIPYTLSMRGSDIKEFPKNSEKYIDDLSKVINLSSGIHCVCDDLWNEAAKVCTIDKASVFQRTIYTTVPIRPLNKKSNPRSESFLFIAIGRLHWMKNFVGLLIAFKKLLEKGFNGKLIIVGDGAEKTSLIYWTNYLQLNDFVTFKGTLPYSVIEDLFEQADGYIQSSISEGLSNSLAEAMAIGVPVFATNVGGTGEVIKDTVNGYLLDPEHPEDWWKKLILLRDNKKIQTIRERAWNDANEKFSAKIHAGHFKDFYSKCIEK
jgi:glycosyltransferase involved in cell wall biosynthesis